MTYIIYYLVWLAAHVVSQALLLITQNIETQFKTKFPQNKNFLNYFLQYQKDTIRLRLRLLLM